MAVALTAGALALLVAAVALRLPTLLLLALPLLIAPLVGLAAVGRGPSATTFAWREDGEGPDVRISGELRAASPATAARLELSVEMPEGIRALSPLRIDRPGDTVRFAWSGRCDRPLLAQIAPPRVSVRDPLGLVDRPVPIDAAALSIVRVPPEVARVRRLPYRRTTLLPGEAVARALGPSGEFFGVRPAVPGDPARAANPRATARRGRPCVNEFRTERAGDLLLVLDARPTELGPALDRELLTMSRAVGLGLARGFLTAKERVGLALFGEFVETLPLGTGRVHAARIERTLTAATVAATAGPPERLAVSVRRAFPPGVTTILLTSLADADGGPVLAHLRQRGFPAVVLSPSPLPLLASELGGSDEGGALRRLLALERRARIARTWEEAPTLDWASYWSVVGLPDLLRIASGAGRHG